MEEHNSSVIHPSSGSRSKVVDSISVREAEATLGKQGLHPELVHEHSTGPWEVTGVVKPGLSSAAFIREHSTRHKTVSVVDSTALHQRPEELRNDFGDEYALLAWRVDVRFADP